jgi:hypothetical protein
MDDLSTFTFEASQFLWPLFTLFQLVITVMAVRKVKGPGPLLMLAGTLFVVVRTVANYLPDEMSFSAGDMEAFWAMMGIAMLGRGLFLIGLLLMVLGVYKPQTSGMGRTEF